MKKQTFSKIKAGQFLDQYVPTLDLTLSDMELQDIVRQALYDQFTYGPGVVYFINWKQNGYIVKWKYNSGNSWAGC